MSVEISDSLKNQVWGDQQVWRKECRIKTVMRKISGMLKMARSVLPAGAESDIAFIFKIEAKLRSVEEMEQKLRQN